MLNSNARAKTAEIRTRIKGQSKNKYTLRKALNDPYLKNGTQDLSLVKNEIKSITPAEIKEYSDECLDGLVPKLNLTNTHSKTAIEGGFKIHSNKNISVK